MRRTPGGYKPGVQAEDAAIFAGVAERRAPERWFGRFAAFVLAYLLFVILFGAWVRISGSGAGCGDHWPTCGGQLVPRAPSVQTLIEYTHRITSGALGLMALGIADLGFSGLPAAAPGALLCPGHLPAGDARGGHRRRSGAEAAGGEQCVRGASGGGGAAPDEHVVAHRGRGVDGRVRAGGAACPGVGARGHLDRSRPASAGSSRLLVGLVLVAASGAVTALGDTLFPVYSVAGVAPARPLPGAAASGAPAASVLHRVRQHPDRVELRAPAGLSAVGARALACSPGHSSCSAL